MKSLGRFFLWSAVFLLLLIVLDQILVRVPFKAPVLAQGREFYLEFRDRALHRSAVSRGGDAKPAPSVPSPRSPSPGPRYVYVDGEGSLQFADSLAEVPKRFRNEARPLER